MGKYLKNSNNGSVDQSKDLLVNLYLKDLNRKGISKEPTETEIKNLFLDPYFLEIKRLCRKNPNLIFLFTKIFFEDLQQYHDSDDGKKFAFKEMLNLYDSLMERKTSWIDLPLPIDKYATIEQTRDKRNSLERLSDDWRDLCSSINTNKFIKRLLPFQREFINMDNPLTKEKIEYISDSFMNFGKGEDGKIDPVKNKQLQDEFFIKYDWRTDGKARILKRIDYIARYRNLHDLIDGATSHIESSSKSTYTDRLDLITQANKTLSPENGAEILYMEKGVMVIEVKSFQANRIINSNTSHCIKDSLSMWDNYLSPEKYRKQFYIYDFNIPYSDNMSVMGFTMDEHGKIIHCHLKNDAYFLDNISRHLKKLNIPDGVLVPINESEKADRRKRISKNKVIELYESTYDEIKEALTEGGDVNYNNVISLKNAIKKNDKKLVDLLLSFGAQVNAREDLLVDCLNLDIEVLCSLVSKGIKISLINFVKLKSILNKYNNLEKLLSSGLNPDLLDGVLVRESISSNDIDTLRLLTRYGADYGLRSYLCIYNVMSHKGIFNVELVDEVFDTLKKQRDEFFRDENIHKNFIINKIFDDYPLQDGNINEKVERCLYILKKISKNIENGDEFFNWVKKEIKNQISKEKSLSITKYNLNNITSLPKIRFLELLDNYII